MLTSATWRAPWTSAPDICWRQKVPHGKIDWLPNVEPFVLPDATHLLQVENPRGMADGVTAFFARHPLTVSDKRAVQ
jgi:pimeloyl-ACP methyl ester carboxylesterase